MLSGMSLSTRVRFDAAVTRPLASTVNDGTVPTVLPYIDAVTPVFTRVNAPVFMSVASPERGTPAATFDPFPINIFPLLRVEGSFPLKVDQSVLVRYPFVDTLA